MGRPKKPRKHRYKSYFEKDAEEEDIPESTLRYQTATVRRQNHEESTTESDHLSEISDHGDNSLHNDQDNPDISDHSDNSHHNDQDDPSSKSSQDIGLKSTSSSSESSASSPSTLVSDGESQGSNVPQIQVDGDGHSTETEIVSRHNFHRRSPREYISDEDLSPPFNFNENDSSSDSDSSASSLSGLEADVSSSEEELLPNREGDANGLSPLRRQCHRRQATISHWRSTSESSLESSVEERRQQGGQMESDAVNSSCPNSTDSSSSSSTSHTTNECEQQCEGNNDEENTVISEEENNGPRKVNAFARLRSSVEKTVNVNVSIALGEVLSNLLSLAEKHHLSHLEKENIMKFANSILNSGEVLPCSRFLLDEYFYSKDDMVYHFFCSECSEFLGSVPAENPRPGQVICPNSTCDRVNLLSDLSQATFFVTFDVPSQIELILRDKNLRDKFVNPALYADIPEPVVIRDLYDGKMYREFAKEVKYDADNASKQVISFVLSVDSASLCSFSGQAICPCFLMILELPPVLRMKHLLLAGLWFGKGKEKMDLFLPPIVQHITELSTHGFSVNIATDLCLSMKSYLRGCCADSVARCDVQGIHGHRGDFPCSWCLIEGVEFGGKRIFRFSAPCASRSLTELMKDADEALRTCSVVNGVKYMCPLAPAPLFHSIHGFIVDQMHAKDEGVTKAFVKAWLGEDGKTTYYIGSPSNLKIMNARMKNVKPPKEFRKAIRDLSHLGHWTGREFENFGLFLSTPVVLNILPERYLKHWGLYIQAIYILLLSEIPCEAVDIAEILIEEFCCQTETLYGLHMMKFNLHILRHFSENCRLWGNIYAVSAYAFEAGNQTMKKLVHNSNYIPNQICRGISERNALVLLKTICKTSNTSTFEEAIDRKPTSRVPNLAGNIRLKGKAKRLHPTEEELWLIQHSQMDPSDLVQYDQIVKDGCHYEASARRGKTDNSYTVLKDGKVCKIKRIIHNTKTDEVWMFCARVRCNPSPYVPLSVVRFRPSISFQFVVTSIDEDVQFLNVNQLSTVCVSIELTNGHYICPMPNIINMF